ncbi:Elongator complex protein 4 [Amphibalanus amphitrite]|uniref:Elongator complex protein 4 n=1 Tax=Amphibalanus amphitrite TaxID=1232801 RepID=A0A6A4WQV8_AMPAM|nr:Elongator complex protein 4 [Amphibalanus amphitrite]
MQEDQYGDYAHLVLSYFMSEAVCNRHRLLAASLDADPSKMILELPSPADGEVTAVRPPAGAADQRMTIAWRYQGLPQQPAPAAGRFGQHYDLSRYIEKSAIDAMDISLWPEDEPPGADHAAASDRLDSLLAACDRLASGAEPDTAPTVRRLAVRSLGSPLWSAPPELVVRACHLLRALLRVTGAVAMVTVPTHLWTDEALVARLRRCADISIGLESFQGTPAAQSPAFSEYHGLVHVHRLSARNVLAARYPRHPDLAFKVRRKKFSVETLHLPPELSETASRSQEDDSAPARKARPAAGCQAARPGAPLDF